jgi:CD109 antigen
MPRQRQSASIETTAYATLALVESGELLSAGQAARWLVSRRNSFGGFGSTQDTVVGLQALTRFASGAKADVDMAVSLRAGNWRKELRVNQGNFDVLQIVEAPLGAAITAQAQGKGQVVLQAVRRYNVPEADEVARPIFDLKVEYGAGQIEVDDLITVTATLRFDPPEPMEAGMTVLDVAVPTGFAPETASIDNLVKGQGGKIKRYEVAARKVIFYIENLQPGERLQFAFQARALFPVKAQAVTSQTYSYYNPEWKAESLGGALVVS